MTTIDSQGNLHGGDGKFTNKGQNAAGFDLSAPLAPPATIAPEPSRAFAEDITYDELVAMSAHDAPVESRLAAVSTPYPGVATRASHDPDPFVRAIASRGWDLPAEDVARLDADPEVRRVRAVLSGSKEA